MKQKITFLFYQLLLVVMMLPLTASAQTERVINQIQIGKEEITVADGEVITFKDFMGDSSLSEWSSKSQALTVFKSGVPGKVVMLRFDEFDVHSGGTYPGWVNIYSGVADADNSFAFVEDSYDLKNTMKDMPAGNLLEEHLEGTFTDKTYYSTSDDGALSVATLFVTAKTCTGFKATVQLVTPEDMQIISSGSRYDDVTNTLTGKKNVAFAGIYVETEGFGSPDCLTKIVFNASKNDDAIDVTSLRLYRGRYADIDFKNVNPIDVTINKIDATHFEMSMNYALATGMNDFTLVGDFKQDAAIGAQVCVEADKIISKKTPAGIASFAKGDAVTVSVPAIELMQEGHTTVNVGETPISFFDNGGVDGKSLISEGITTFVPSVEGKKVMIDFTKVDLFMAYDGNRKESLRIYNGKEAKEENLIQIITEKNTCLIRSTSADGALTVKYTDEETAEYSKHDGFEATVSLFTPQPMQYDGVTVERILGGNVCAGTSGVQILKLCVNTSNTEPVLSASKFDFTTNNTFGIVSKAHLYYTKGSDKFGILHEIGSADITSDNFTITAAEAQPLIEGKNYFWLVYDVKPEAQNDQKLSAAAVSVTLSNGVHAVENGNPEGALKIENVVISSEKQQEFTVFGSMAFKSQPSEYGSGHESGLADQVTIFRPAHEGKIMSLDFSLFDLTYDSSSYGTRAKFIVYNGIGTKGNILWQLDSSEKKAGPDKVLRSSTVDGAITIVFNPNTSSSYYCGKGFDAMVSEYESKPMQADLVTVAQAPQVTVASGDQNIRILDITLTTSGDKGSVSFDEMALDLKGCEKSLARVKLYRNDNDAAPVAEKEITADDKSIVLTLNSENLVEGENLYNVRFDLNDASKGGDILDAAVTSVKVSGKSVKISNGDPEGSFDVKDIYNLKSGDNGVKTIAKGASLSFFDDGGADAEASKSFSGTITFVPETEGDAIVFDFKEYEVNYGDEMTIYYGDKAEGTPAFTFGMYDKPKPLEVTPITSKAADGKLTVKFVTGNYPGAGFNIVVSAKERKPLAISGVTAEAVTPAGVLKGETDVPMIKVAVNVEGDHKTTEVTKFELGSYAQNALSDVKIYATGTNAEYSTANLFGTKKADNNVIEGSYVIDNAGTYYFFIAADINTAVAEGDAANVALKSVNDMAAEAMAETSVIKGVSGTLTVGAGEQYNTIQEAIDALKGGIDGPVTINIKPGIYKEGVKVPEIKGASANNTVTLRSESGNYKDVKIYYEIYNEPSEYKDYYGTFTIDGADYFTLSGVEVTTGNAEFESVVHIKNHSQHVTIDNCYIHTKMCTSYSDGDISLVKTYAENIENRNSDYITITNCLLEGGHKGAYVGGTGFVALPKQHEALVKGNKFVNQGSIAIYAPDQLGVKIIDNEIINNATTASEFKAIDVKVRDLNDYDVEISGNHINISASTTQTVLYIREMKASAEHPARIYNNEVISNGGDGDSRILTLSSDDASNMEFAYNTFSMNSASATPLVHTNKVLGENVSFVNNIFENKQSEKIFFLGKGVSEGTVFESNVFATESDIIATLNGAEKTFDQFVAETKAVNCYKENVTFCSENVLEPMEQGSLLNAKALAHITKDITGVERNAQTPTIGAYEYNPSTEAPVMAEGYPSVKNITETSAVVVVNTDLSGKAYVLALATDVEAPTAETIKTTGVTADVIRGNETEITVDGLVKDGMYRAYVIVESYRGTQSAVSKTYDFKASADQIIEYPDPVVTTEFVTAEKGSMAVLKANVTSGTAPYSLEWKNSLNEVVATTTLSAAGDATIEIEAVSSGDYTVIVTDKYKKTASEWIRLTVLGEAETATFENLYLDEESYWNGADLRYSFVSGSYLFDNFFDADLKYWGGFAYSNVTDTEFQSYTDATAYSSAAGSGFDGSANYAEINCFMPATITVMNNEVGDNIRGFYVTNAACAYKAVVDGLLPARKFVQGDWLMLTIKDVDTDKKVEYYLADYRSENEADHYVLDTWQWVDLRSLGTVKSLSFQVTGSDGGDFGLNTPAYFCMDNFNGHRVITEVPAQIIDIEGFESTLDLAQFFTFDNNNATIAYSIDEVITEGEFNLSVEGSNLVIKGSANGDFTVIVKAVQNGKIQFISIPVTFATSLNGVDADEFQNVKYRYTIDGKRINTNSRKQGVNIIRDNNGEVKKVVVK